MSKVTQYLRNAIIKQVADHGVVVWYDPQRHYAEMASKLTISNTTIERYTDSFFALRRAVEPLLEQAHPPRLVIYVPLDPAETHNALVELETAGVVMKPGQQPPARNTRLALIARRALTPVLGQDSAAAIEKQVEAGKLTLANLDALAEKGEGISSGVISVIYGSDNPEKIGLAFLTDAGRDADLTAKKAVAELAALLQNAFGGSDKWKTAALKPDDLRRQFARHILLTDFFAAIPNPNSLPDALALPLAAYAALSPAVRQACLNLANTWRLRRDLRQSYITHSGHVEQTFKLAALRLGRAQIAQSQTFLSIEKKLQQQIAAELWRQANPQALALARQRQSGFWAEARPAIQAEWALIAVSGQVLLAADRIEQEMRQSQPEAKAIFERYTGSVNGAVANKTWAATDDERAPRPWCLLDTHHRHLERRCHHFDFDLGKRHVNLNKLIAKARDRYMTVGAELAKTFLEQYRQAEFHLPGIPRQLEIFENQVKPRLGSGKTAYIWVDALRFEMARELAQTLSPEFNVEMQAVVGTVPTITPIGMAALLPNAQQSPSVVSVGGGELGLVLGETVLKDRKGRIAYLSAHAGTPVFAARLDNLLPQPGKKTQQKIKQASLILITSQEIDALCEEDNIPLARRTMDEILHELRRAVRILKELGAQNFIITADHGYLFGEEIGEEMKIDAPGGNTVDLHRRVWIGKGGAAHPAYLRAKLADFGLNDELELATPWNFAVFKVSGGAKAYFHGGLSPQELIIPVIAFSAGQTEAAPLTGDIHWTLVLGSASGKIGRFCSVQVGGSAAGLFEITPPAVRVEVRAGNKIISTPVTASYNFAEGTGDVQLRLQKDNPKAIEPNTISLMITRETSQKKVSVHLVDAAGGAELGRLKDIELALGIQ